jgi:hypothetical protein
MHCGLHRSGPRCPNTGSRLASFLHRVAARIALSTVAAGIILGLGGTSASAITASMSSAHASSASAANSYFLTSVPTSCAISSDFSGKQNNVTVAGTGFRPNQPFTIYLKPQVVAKPMTNRTGNFAVDVPIPANVTGPQTLQVYGAGCAIEVTFNIAPSTSAPTQSDVTPPANLSSGGGGSFPTRLLYLIVGIVVVAGAGVLVLVSRTGRRPAT